MRFCIGLLLILLSANACQADIFVMSGTGLFNQSLGTLNSVTVRFRGTNVSLGSSVSNNHTITSTSVGFTQPPEFASLQIEVLGTVAGSGYELLTTQAANHDHTISPISFNWNGKAISLTQPVVSSSSGSHSHTVTNLKLNTSSQANGTAAIAAGAVVSTGPSHSHTFSYDEGVTFTGSDLSLFLSGGGPSAAYGFSVTESSTHAHSIATGTYKAAAGLNFFDINLTSAILLSTVTETHSSNVNDNVYQTIFDFSPSSSSVPEPSSLILLSVATVLGSCGRKFFRRRNTKQE